MNNRALTDREMLHKLFHAILGYYRPDCEDQSLEFDQSMTELDKLKADRNSMEQIRSIVLGRRVVNRGS